MQLFLGKQKSSTISCGIKKVLILFYFFKELFPAGEVFIVYNIFTEIYFKISIISIHQFRMCNFPFRSQLLVSFSIYSGFAHFTGTRKKKKGKIEKVFFFGKIQIRPLRFQQTCCWWWMEHRTAVEVSPTSLPMLPSHAEVRMMHIWYFLFPLLQMPPSHRHTHFTRTWTAFIGLGFVPLSSSGPSQNAPNKVT